MPYFYYVKDEVISEERPSCVVVVYDEYKHMHEEYPEWEQRSYTA